MKIIKFLSKLTAKIMEMFINQKNIQTAQTLQNDSTGTQITHLLFHQNKPYQPTPHP